MTALQAEPLHPSNYVCAFPHSLFLFFISLSISPPHFLLAGREIFFQFLLCKMADHHDLPYQAEYAKSNRSTCKACKTNINKDRLRMAVMVQVSLYLKVNLRPTKDISFTEN